MNTITVDDLHSALGEVKAGKALVVDVRTEAEYQDEHMPISMNIPLDHLHEYKDLIKSKDKVYIHCADGGRSQVACKALEMMDDIHNIYNVEGGIHEWEQHGFKVIKNHHTHHLSLERQTRLILGIAIMLSVVLVLLTKNINYILIAGVVGLGLMNAGLTGWCGVALLIAKAPWNKVTKKTGK